MKTVRFFARLIFGLTFIVSGFFKITDPVGTGLIVGEYLKAMHLDFASFLALPGGILLSGLELLTGVAVLLGLRMRIASTVGLCLTGFFTLLTVWIYFYSPVEDCGCFGEAVRLTDGQTLLKNVVLLLCIVPVFLYRKRFRLIAPEPAEWIFLGFYALGALALALRGVLFLPTLDFGDFRVGTNLLAKLDNARQTETAYETFFLYEKDGVRREFGLENLPDSTWTFVDSRTVASGVEGRVFDFPVTDDAGNYVTEELLSRNRTLWAVVRNVSRHDAAYWYGLAALSDSLSSRESGTLVVLLASVPEDADSLSAVYGIPRSAFHYSDYRTMISMNRSDGGLVYVEDAVVVRKWPSRRISGKRIRHTLSEDSEIVTARGIIRQQLIYEGAIIGIVLSVVLMRYICGMAYDSRRHYRRLRRLAVRRQNRRT